jgi:hypothetical protein
MRLLVVLACLVAAPALASAQAIPPITNLKVAALENDDGRHLAVSFARDAANSDPDAGVVTAVFRWRPAARKVAVPLLPLVTGATLATGDALGPWTVAAVLTAGETGHTDEVTPGHAYVYAVAELKLDGDGAIREFSSGVWANQVEPDAAVFHTKRWGYLLIVLLIGGLIAYYIDKARRRPEDLFIRRIPGVDAIEDAVGRSTEMGRPVLYVTGLEEIQDIQTLASLLILGHVAELTATYDTEIKVANYFPLTMVVAEEIVRAGYANAGRIDAHRPENVMFITAEQFAFAAGVNGLILRDRPATNIYFGKFFGESLLLAETGFLTGAVQIAGTAELAQLPFFVAACDYTLIGEEMYATSAYLSREPTLLANLKAGDRFKVTAMLFIVAGAALATAGAYQLGPLVFP